MNNYIDIILNNNMDLFGANPSVSKIDIGFTNTIYSVDDTYIIKVCTDIDNETNFMKEINFYNHNKNNSLIPKLYIYDNSKNIIPYYYEVLEKIKGVSLYNVWHTYTEEEREDIIRQLCDAMKLMHSNKGEAYDWSKYMKDRFISLFDKVKELKVFSSSEEDIINQAYLLFDKYLESDLFVLVHNDLHFDNVFVYDGKIKIIDFERSMYAPCDYELAIIYRMIRKPWKFASLETEDYTDIKQYENIMLYIEKYYPELVSNPYLYKRLAIYDIVYNLKHVILYPELEELRNDIKDAALLVLK